MIPSGTSARTPSRTPRKRPQGHDRGKVMRRFKHMTHVSGDEKLARLRDEYGLVGYIE